MIYVGNFLYASPHAVTRDAYLDKGLVADHQVSLDPSPIETATQLTSYYTRFTSSVEHLLWVVC